MSQMFPTYDLGNLDPPVPAGRGRRAQTTTRRPARATATRRLAAAPAARAPESASAPPPGVAWRSRLPDLVPATSFVLPGGAQLIRGSPGAGLLFASSLGLLATVGWALLVSLERLDTTLPLLGLPRPAAVWGLATIYGLVACLHVLAVFTAGAAVHRRGVGGLGYTAAGAGSGTHPLLATVASALYPGVGQMLNGCRGRAAALVGGLWLIGAAWILSLPAVPAFLAGLHLELPDWALLFSSSPVRWTLTVVIWALAVQDAAATAAASRRRRQS